MGYYIYETLKTTGRPLRLLRILPEKDFSAEIQCLLEPANLDEAPEYVALSYCWGENGGCEKVPISVNGAKFFVTPNLAIALRNLRDHFCKDKALPFWVDALCIDQFNISERSQQVQMMGEIFGKAQRVVLWLGEEEDDSDLAMDLIHALGTGLLSTGDLRTWAAHSRITECKAWEALSTWASRSAWGRIWILQEFVLGSELVILCGNKSISWPVLEAAFRTWFDDIAGNPKAIFRHYEDDTDLAFRITLNKWLAQRIWYNLRSALRRNEPSQDILQVLLSAPTLHATDPRDMIYGLLGITRHNVTADYSKSTREVYVDFATGFLEQGQFSVLNCAGSGLSGPSDHSCNLPSWVPDWHPVCHGNTLPCSEGLYKAGTLHHFLPETRSVVVVDARSLVLSGCECQVVTKTFPNFIREEAWWHWVAKEAGNFLHYTKMSFLETLFRTLLLDTDEAAKLRGSVSRLDATSAVCHDLAAGFCMFLSRSAVQYIDKYSRHHPNPSPAVFANICEWFTELKAILDRQEALDSSLHGLNFRHIFKETYANTSYPCSDERGVVNDPFFTGFVTKMIINVVDRTFFTTSDGYFGIGPRFCKETDIICAIVGLETLAMLRKVGDHYELVGTCFMLGFMDGEALEAVEDGTVELQKFEIW